jgi:hypothetical protein
VTRADGFTPQEPMAAPVMPDRSLWSVWLGAGRGRCEGGRERVILVPDGGSLPSGFLAARPELGQGDLVRLIGRGVTVRRHWPDWVHHADALVLTELDAYLPRDRAACLLPLRTNGKRWLSEVFRQSLDITPVERVFWASFANRLLLPAFAALPLALGVAHHHGAHSIRCVTPDWPGTTALRALLHGNGELLTSDPAPLPRWRWSVKVAAWMGTAVVVAAVFRWWEYLRQREARARLGALRRDSRHDPSLWIGVLGHWPRASRHVVTAVSEATRARGELLGVILQDSLRPGHQEVSPSSGAPAGFFPTLDEPSLRDLIGAVDQCASSESIPQLATMTVDYLRRGLTIALRLVRMGPWVDLGPVRLKLDRFMPALVKLGSIDVLRALEAERAGQALTRRHRLEGKKIVWAHASLANLAGPDVIAQMAGATTYELVHGAFADRVDVLTYAASTSSVRLVWSEAEARFLSPVAAPQQCLGGFVPTPPNLSRPETGHRGPIRILATTNYGHGYGTQQRDRPALDVYEVAFFEALAAALQAARTPVEVRWRPHPDDDRNQVDHTLRAFAALEMSLSFQRRSLEEDLAWGQLIVTSWSSSVLQALSLAVPIFVHEIPLYESTGVMASIDPGRRFETTSDLVERLVPCLRRIPSTDPDLLAPEERLRREFFGPAGTPRSLTEVLWEPTPARPSR